MRCHRKENIVGKCVFIMALNIDQIYDNLMSTGLYYAKGHLPQKVRYENGSWKFGGDALYGLDFDISQDQYDRLKSKTRSTLDLISSQIFDNNTDLPVSFKNVISRYALAMFDDTIDSLQDLQFDNRINWQEVSRNSFEQAALDGIRALVNKFFETVPFADQLETHQISGLGVSSSRRTVIRAIKDYIEENATFKAMGDILPSLNEIQFKSKYIKVLGTKIWYQFEDNTELWEHWAGKEIRHNFWENDGTISKLISDGEIGDFILSSQKNQDSYIENKFELVSRTIEKLSAGKMTPTVIQSKEAESNVNLFLKYVQSGATKRFLHWRPEKINQNKAFEVLQKYWKISYKIKYPYEKKDIFALNQGYQLFSVLGGIRSITEYNNRRIIPIPYIRPRNTLSPKSMETLQQLAALAKKLRKYLKKMNHDKQYKKWTTLDSKRGYLAKYVSKVGILCNKIQDFTEKNKIKLCPKSVFLLSKLENIRYGSTVFFNNKEIFTEKIKSNAKEIQVFTKYASILTQNSMTNEARGFSQRFHQPITKLSNLNNTYRTRKIDQFKRRNVSRKILIFTKTYGQPLLEYNMYNLPYLRPKQSIVTYNSRCLKYMTLSL